jgi:hypothetical protein
MIEKLIVLIVVGVVLYVLWLLTTGSAQADKPVRHWGSYPGDESASIKKKPVSRLQTQVM